MAVKKQENIREINKIPAYPKKSWILHWRYIKMILMYINGAIIY